MSIAGEFERLILAAAIESVNILLSSASICKRYFRSNGRSAGFSVSGAGWGGEESDVHYRFPGNPPQASHSFDRISG